MASAAATMAKSAAEFDLASTGLVRSAGDGISPLARGDSLSRSLSFACSRSFSSASAAHRDSSQCSRWEAGKQSAHEETACPMNHKSGERLCVRQARALRRGHPYKSWDCGLLLLLLLFTESHKTGCCVCVCVCVIIVPDVRHPAIPTTVPPLVLLRTVRYLECSFGLG